MPRVSVIILTRNRAGLLQIALDSALAQTYRDIEIIVVDDASTDDTPNVVARYGDRVRYVRKPANEGEAAGRNTGVRTAAGELIAFLDDDDFYFPQKIARQVQLLDARPDVGVAYCRYVYADAVGNPVWKSGALPDGDILAELVSYCFVLSHAALTRRECFGRVGEFDPTLPSSPDWDMWLRMAQAGIRFGCVQTPLVAYRQHAANVTINVGKWSSAHTIILDRLFANPDLPEQVKAQRAKAYATSRASSAVAYYSQHDFDKAKTKLTEALGYDTSLREPAVLAQMFIDAAFDARGLHNPIALLESIFANLPGEAEFVRPLKASVYSSAMVIFALRLYAAKSFDRARHTLMDAASPFLTDSYSREDFAQRFRSQTSTLAVSLPVESPLAFAQTVFDTLPPSLGWLGGERAGTISEIAMSAAIEAYASGQNATVRKSVWMAMRNRPAWVANRGLWAMAAKSLFSRDVRA